MNRRKKFTRVAAAAVTGVGGVIVAGASPAMASPEVPSIDVAPAPTPEPVAPEPAPAPQTTTISGGERILEQAQQYLGTPYVWGGEDAGGMDCSGFIYRVFSNLGIELPRTSAAQAGAGTAVGSLDQAQPGDLLFFDSDGDGVINHVAIYVSPGRMMDSATFGEVVQERDIWATPNAIRHIDVAGEEVPVEAAPEEPEEVPEAQTEVTYTVESGDWLSKIAPNFGITWQELYEENREVIGDNPNLIYPGQVYFVGGLPLAQAPVTVEEEAAEPTPEPVPEVELTSAFIVNSAGPVSARTQHAADSVFTNVPGAQLITLGGTRASAVDPDGHPSGNALDYMVLADAALGDAIVSYHVANWDELGVEYIIWQQRILTSPNGTWEWMEDRGSATANHYDHVHVNYLGS